MADDYQKALMTEIMRAMMADPRGMAQGRPPEIGPFERTVDEFDSAYTVDRHAPREVSAGAHGFINPEKIKDAARGPALPQPKPEVAARMEALAGARGLVSGDGMSKPNELAAAQDPAALQAFLAKMPPEARMMLIQKLQGAGKPKM